MLTSHIALCVFVSVIAVWFQRLLKRYRIQKVLATVSRQPIKQQQGWKEAPSGLLTTFAFVSINPLVQQQRQIPEFSLMLPSYSPQ